jgi:predicted AlkP superfamily phosphohydrolase/phosphomutase
VDVKMAGKDSEKISRRTFLRRTGLLTAAVGSGLATNPAYAGRKLAHFLGCGRKVVVIGIDGMDPVLSARMMDQGRLPNFKKLRDLGGFSRLGTSNPPQSPVAWANFINGAGPGSHGIFDFIHRHPQQQCEPFFAVAETVAGQGYIDIGKYKIQLGFWPFDDQPSETVLRRQGTPFWDYLDRAGIRSAFYDLPANYPPSRSKFGHHKCLAGLGTPDLLGTYGTCQCFSEDGPLRTTDEHGSRRSVVLFEDGTSKPAVRLIGPPDSMLKEPQDTFIDFVVHKDDAADAALIEIQNQKILLKHGQWSKWIQLRFPLSKPGPDGHISAICRFYLQEVSPNFRLYASPINADPTDPAIRFTEPERFSRQISSELGLFPTTGFQEDYNARKNKIFTDEEYVHQAGMVLDERLDLLDYAKENYIDGLLFFYFSSTDLQGHIFWWDSDDKHPVRSADAAKKYFAHLQDIYRRLDFAVGGVLAAYGDKATVMVLSDHGFSNFGRQFALNAWLRENGYIKPANAAALLGDVDWGNTTAYGLGINGLYLNLKGREKYGIVDPSHKDKLLNELVARLESVRDDNGNSPIKKVRRSDEIYSGKAMALAPDLIVGYRKDYRASWATCLGGMDDFILADNNMAWSADHCCDSSEIPGVLFANKPIKAKNPSLVDVAPTILAEFGIDTPASMTGTNVL